MAGLRNRPWFRRTRSIASSQSRYAGVITGTGINFAIPADKIKQVLNGRVADTAYGEPFQQGNAALLPINVQCLDPLNRIRGMKMEVWAGNAGPDRPLAYQPPAALAGDGPRQSSSMNYVNGGPNGKTLAYLTNGNVTSNVLLVWDHGKTPGCADWTHAAAPANPRGPWPFPDATSPRTHYPDQRHANVFNVLYCDGHTTGMTQDGLARIGVAQFLANGTTPTFP